MSGDSEMTYEQMKSFEEAALPLIKWLNENVHPNHTAIVTPTSAELLERECDTGYIDQCSEADLLDEHDFPFAERILTKINAQENSDE